mmetsp:Transcript_31007/g.98991  ORF Transcript_31007/g.98991 Transcript_31007/m.98991 type:complete len:239 (-) Transcript_31007:168-884(-)
MATAAPLCARSVLITAPLSGECIFTTRESRSNMASLSRCGKYCTFSTCLDIEGPAVKPAGSLRRWYGLIESTISLSRATIPDSTTKVVNSSHATSSSPLTSISEKSSQRLAIISTLARSWGGRCFCKMPTNSSRLTPSFFECSVVRTKLPLIRSMLLRSLAMKRMISIARLAPPAVESRRSSLLPPKSFTAIIARWSSAGSTDCERGFRSGRSFLPILWLRPPGMPIGVSDFIFCAEK